MKKAHLVYVTLLTAMVSTFVGAASYLTGDTIRSPDRTKVWTMPAATDTIVGRASTDTLTNKTFNADGTGNSITNIENADIKAGAAIALNKLASVTASRALVSDSSGFVTAAGATTATEIGYVNGVTSSLCGINQSCTETNKTFTTPVIGGNSFSMTGTSSGTVTVGVQAAAGTFNFNLPTTAGSSGAFLTSGGGGSNAMTWTSRVSFSANTSTTAGSTSTRLIYTVEDHDTDNAYDTSTGTFTVPTGKGGVYMICAQYYFGATAASVGIYVGGVRIAEGGTTVSSTATNHICTLVTLNASNVVDIRPLTSATASGGSNGNIFYGFKLN